MKNRKMPARRTVMTAVFAALFCGSLCVNGMQHAKNRALETRLAMERQRDMSDVVRAMADIEVNLQKLMIASGAEQNASLLGETALLAQHVETGLARLPLSAETSSGVIKFAGQMGDYVMTLSSRISSGGMLGTEDERRISLLLEACQGLNAHLLSVGESLYSRPIEEIQMYTDEQSGWQEEAFSSSVDMYPSLIYDGPFSDGKNAQTPHGLTGGRITRQQAKEEAARYTGARQENIREAADSGGVFEAFGFLADAPDGTVSVQITGQGGHLLWMMPERAEFEKRYTQEECLEHARIWLEEMGFGQMKPCFVQEYDGMTVANFAAVQNGVLIYPEQVKIQVSMQSLRVVGAECSQYWMNRIEREPAVPQIGAAQAQMMLSSRLEVDHVQLCVIPSDTGERLCWEFRGAYAGETYFVYVDAHTGEAAQILRISRTAEGETAI